MFRNDAWSAAYQYGAPAPLSAKPLDVMFVVTVRCADGRRTVVTTTMTSRGVDLVVWLIGKAREHERVTKLRSLSWVCEPG